jgi:branched-chain amino acid aminotransferase
MRIIRLDGVVVAGAEGIGLDDPLARSGDGLVETMRARQGQIAHRAAHLARLAASINALGMVGVPDLATIETELDAALGALAAAHAKVRLVVSTRSKLWVEVESIGPLPEQPGTATAITIPGGWSPGRRIAEHKTSSRAHWNWAERQALSAGADVALVTDAQGRLGESTKASVFVVDGDRLFTAPVDGLLPGIGRQVTMELHHGVVEHAAWAETWQAADEVFLVSAVRGITAVTAIDGRLVGDGSVGPLTAHVAASYRARVATETGPGVCGRT